MMKYYARFNSEDFIITSMPIIRDALSQTQFSTISIDFRGYSESYLPIQLQEITIVQIDEEDTETTLFVGYVYDIEYPEFTSDDTPFIIDISLLNPYNYASKRSVSTSINAVALNDAIKDILQPLLDDNFTIEYNDLSSDKLVSIVIQNETVEKMMNYMANRYDFTWYIDNAKKIYLKDLDKLKSQTPVLNITDANRHNLASIQPIKSVVDYANRINIKNANLLVGQVVMLGFDLIEDTVYDFEYPFSISENVAYRIGDYDDLVPDIAYSFRLVTDIDTYSIEIDKSAKTITYDSEIGFSGVDDETIGKKILLITDVVDTTKIIGFKWNTSTETVSAVFGLYIGAAIVPYQVTYLDPNEISTIKSKLNTGGIIEKIIDANGKYFIGLELEEYAVSQFKKNNVATNEIKCKFKGRLNDNDFVNTLNLLKLSNVISIDLPGFLTSGDFIITGTYYKANTETAELTISAKNYNINENFLDIFRIDVAEDSEDTLVHKIVAFYNQDNKTVLEKQILVNGEVVSNV